MENVEPQKVPVQIPFVCPVCAGPNAVELLTLSRAGGMDCAECGKWLKSADVMRAMHAPRSAPTAERRVRPAIAKRAAMVWPPTAESRAAVPPLRTRDPGRRN